MRFDVTRYSKFIVAIAGAVSIAVADGFFDAADGVNIALAVLAAIGVWGVPNTTPEGA